MKKMIKIAFVAAFVAIAGYGVYTNQKSETLSDLTLDNVEALAAGESGYDTCLGSGNVTCSTGEKVECVIRPFGLD